MPMPAGNTPEPSAVAIAHLHRGNKIAAIKQVRMEQGVDLVDAKALVDRYVALHPDLQGGMAKAQKGTVGQFLFGLAITAVLGVAVYLWLHR